MNFYFHPEAEQELLQAVSYYESCRPGLGIEFADEVYQAIKRIITFPDSYASFSTNTRRCILNRFPYGLLYANQKKDEKIIILAVMNLHLKPDRWENRNQ
ncbi:MAG: type II toxin-antitoxin system RelE/ParE family toxin [Methanospirillum sp.]|uniref:type II toxin-antitoxin system RelE/ParE family toxin n=1 Tax=Methanospirillum sp. TaxID=45200 RepID=UPI0023712C6A|nr:type II toxin-antitoxin system RelE/ParE family toxin [Methanospirillum sp.]MDD1729787.1 type II toxin-antitoxin system RelE/ParE family toxin [Methanospirillum sp.]